MLLVSEVLVLPVPMMNASLVNIAKLLVLLMYAQSSRQESIVQRMMLMYHAAKVTVVPEQLQ